MNIPVEPHVTVNFTQADLNTISKAFDITLKATGLEGAKPILATLAKIENAIAAAQALKQEGEIDG